MLFIPGKFNISLYSQLYSISCLLRSDRNRLFSQILSSFQWAKMFWQILLLHFVWIGKLVRKPWRLEGRRSTQEHLSKLQNVFVWVSKYICSTRKPWLDGRTSAEAEQTPLIRTAASYIFNANRIEAFHGRAYFFQNHHSYMIEHEINSRFSSSSLLQLTLLSLSSLSLSSLSLLYCMGISMPGKSRSPATEWTFTTRAAQQTGSDACEWTVLSWWSEKCQYIVFW